MVFKVGDYAVCPGHGVGQICDIEARDFGGVNKSFYIIKVLSNGMTVMVPVDSNNGIRPLVDDDQIGSVYTLLTDHNIKIDNSTWNRRYREYMAKIKTGSLLEIADVLRALFLLKENKPLSFGEKKMLEQCKGLLVEEIALSEGIERGQISTKIDSCFTP